MSRRKRFMLVSGALLVGATIGIALDTVTGTDTSQLGWRWLVHDLYLMTWGSVIMAVVLR